MNRSRPRTVLLAVPLGAVAVAAAAVLASPPTSPVASGGGGSPAPVVLDAEPAALTAFGSCDAFLETVVGQALEAVGPYGLPGGYGIMMPEAFAAADTAGGAPAAARTAGSDGAGTGTNVQVAGVDEGDVAKLLDGILYSVGEGGLHVTDVSGRTPQVLATLRTRDWTPTELLAVPGRLLLVGAAPWQEAQGGDVVPGGGRGIAVPDRIGLPYPQTTRLAEVDVSDPAAPRLVDTLDVEGSVSGARLSDGVARFAVTSSGGRLLPFASPAFDPNTGLTEPGEEERALQANRALVRGSTVDDWLPQVTHDGVRERLVGCADVSAPRDVAGVDVLTLLSVDLAGGGLAQWDSGAVLATGSTVYATADRTYVTTSPWAWWTSLARPVTRTPDTQVHVFATGADEAPRWLASGRVPGTLLGQYALDEHDGVLRAATTTTGLDGTQSESRVTTLRRDGDRLVEAGHVAGMGKGEQIYSVRFIGDVGYVVTFRQVDPLYTLDLSDPARPRVVGELKIEGYSAYLHPAGDGLLLGIGQDATAQGRTTGAQLSLFDVSDPASPQRVDQVALKDAWSSAEGDSHAFTYSGGLALAPFERWTQDGVYQGGTLAVRVEGNRLSEPTTLRTADGPVDPEDAWTSSALRTYVVDDRVVVLAVGGVATFDATSLERTAYTTFG